MKRVIKDFANITPDVMELINEQYPFGYEDSQLVTFVNAKGEFVKALELRTDEIVYLIKLGRKLDDHINEYLDGDDDDNYSDGEGVDVEIEDSMDEDDD